MFFTSTPISTARSSFSQSSLGNSKLNISAVCNSSNSNLNSRPNAQLGYYEEVLNEDVTNDLTPPPLEIIGTQKPLHPRPKNGRIFLKNQKQ